MGFKEGNVLETRHAFLTYVHGGGNSIDRSGLLRSCKPFRGQEMNGSLSLFGFGNLYSAGSMIRYIKKGTTTP
jgi:hypothetical protein